MAEMSLQRTVIILSLFAWCAYVSGERMRQVNCEKYVFHPNCRGSQARKRFMNMVDNEYTEPTCHCANSKKVNNNAVKSLTNSKLLEALFANGFDVNTIYDTYMATSDRRRDYNGDRDRSGQRRKSIRDNSIDLGSPDMDEDY